MQKLITVFLFASLFSYSQIDYKKIIKDLDLMTIDTNLETFFNDIPFRKSGDEITLTDERFLRYYDIIIDKVIIDTNLYGKRMEITLFDDIKDYEILKTKLTEQYGNPIATEYSNYENFSWETDTKTIELKIEIEDGIFNKFRNLVINFKK